MATRTLALPVTTFRVGGIRFLKVGRVNVSWSVSRRKVARAPLPYLPAWAGHALVAALLAGIIADSGARILTAPAPVAQLTQAEACLRARMDPTDINLEICHGEPVSLDPVDPDTLAD